MKRYRINWKTVFRNIVVILLLIAIFKALPGAPPGAPGLTYSDFIAPGVVEYRPSGETSPGAPGLAINDFYISGDIEYSQEQKTSKNQSWCDWDLSLEPEIIKKEQKSPYYVNLENCIYLRQF